MVKFSVKDKNDQRMLGVGLSEENVKRLKEGMPIHIKSEDLSNLTGWEGSIFIMYGKTEDDIKDQLSSLIGPDTDVQDARD